VLASARCGRPRREATDERYSLVLCRTPITVIVTVSGDEDLILRGDVVRRIVGFVLVGFGVALLALGVLLRVWAYPALAQVGAAYPDPDVKDLQVKAGQSISQGTGVQAFIARGPRESPTVGPFTVDLQSERTTRGVPAAAQGDNVYWETSVRTFASGEKLPRDLLNAVVEGVCFNRVTGEANDGCRKKPYTLPNAEGKPDLSYSPRGQYFKFPFNTQQRSYPFWDTLIRQAPDAKYTATEQIQGVKVYKFVQTVPETDLGEFPRALPGALFGSSEPTVKARQVYSNVRTLWIEPETGVIIRGQEEPRRHFVANNTEVAALVGTIGYNDATVASNATWQSSSATSLASMRTLFPWLLAGIGLVLALLGVWLVQPWRDERVAGSGRRARGTPATVDLREADRTAANPS
jgi:hypothetical protein